MTLQLLKEVLESFLEGSQTQLHENEVKCKELLTW